MTESSGEEDCAPVIHSEKLGSKKVSGSIPRIPPGALPWDEEKITFSRDKGKALTRLQRENVILRSQLKDLNKQLDIVINEIQLRRAAKPHRELKSTACEELKLASRKLELTIKEYERLLARFEQLSDYDYKMRLVETVQEQEIQLKALELTQSQKQHFQTKREKVLETVLETGETPEMSKSVELALTELSILKTKTKSLEKADKQTASAFEKLCSREDELTKKIRGLMEELGDVAVDDTTDLQERLESTKNDGDILERQHKHDISKLKSRLKQAQTDLQDTKLQEATLQRQLQERTEAADQSAGEVQKLNTLVTQRISSRIVGNRSKSTKRLSSESKSAVFVTEGKT